MLIFSQKNIINSKNDVFKIAAICGSEIIRNIKKY